MLIPIPKWFDEILARSKDEAIVMWFFLKTSLEKGRAELSMSYSDIQNGTGLYPFAISESIKKLQAFGVLTRVSAGRLSKNSLKPKKAVYRINWNFRGEILSRALQFWNEQGYTKTEVKIDMSKIDVLLKKGEAVRQGRFGEVTKGEAWYSQGYEGVHNDRAGKAEGIAMAKVQNGEVNKMNWLDFYKYFQEKYLDRYGKHYDIGSDIGWTKYILNTLIKRIGHKALLKIIDWFVGVQSVWSEPTIAMLGNSKYFMKILEGTRLYNKDTEFYVEKGD